MRGIDPRIHEAAPRRNPYGLSVLTGVMDCRVKPGNDKRRRHAHVFRFFVLRFRLCRIGCAERFAGCFANFENAFATRS